MTPNAKRAADAIAELDLLINSARAISRKTALQLERLKSRTENDLRVGGFIDLEEIRRNIDNVIEDNRVMAIVANKTWIAYARDLA